MKTRLYMQTLAVVILALMAFATQAANTTYYIYDESGHVIGEYDASGNPIQEHVYLGDRPVAVVQTGAVNGQQSSTLDYVTADQLNTPRDIMDSGQNVVWNWPSDPFGNGQPTGSLTYNLRFPGQYYDAETGHNYNYLRDYDPSTGRYTESDPIGLKAGVNTYAYVQGNPLRGIDEYGLCGHWVQVGSVMINGDAFGPIGQLLANNVCRCVWLWVDGATAWSGNPVDPSLPRTTGVPVGMGGDPSMNPKTHKLDPAPDSCLCSPPPSPHS